jgi:two-component system nitrogen regulation response regulator NtrX
MRILIVDDEPNIRKSLTGLLHDEGYDAESCASGEECVVRLQEVAVDVLFLDVMLPGMDGIEALEKVKSVSPETKVLMMSGQADLDMAVRAAKLGAHTFLEKPLHPDRVLLDLKNLAEQKALEQKVASLENRMGGEEDIVGASGPLRQLLENIQKAAPSEGRVFIYGGNGTGKELVARSVHNKSTRKKGPFVSLNCAALPRDLVESELFGYERGAFTGAVQRKPGLFERADGGTLFLDEVGDMGLETQAKLLRVLQENEAVRLGGKAPYRFDVRVISATNKNIRDEIQNGRFREDLWYRLNVIPLTVPSLRERADDIPLLAGHFLERICGQSGKGMKRFSAEALERLKSHSWPGNVRELRNFVERLIIMNDGRTIGEREVVDALPAGQALDASSGTAGNDPESHGPEGLSLKQQIGNFEKAVLMREYSAVNGHISELARRLNTDRANLYRKLREHGIL